MPGLVRKLLVFAAVDGLVLQPLAQKGQRPTPAITIAYNGNKIGPLLGEAVSPGRSFEAFGIVGLLTVSNTSYLISITRRQLVAHIRGKSIFVVTDVALTPLSSKRDAENAIENTQTRLQKRKADKSADDSDTEDEDGDFLAAVSDDVEDDEALSQHMGDSSIDHTVHDSKRRSSIAEDVMTRKGGYGRFAQKWFSGKGWKANQRRNLGMSITDMDPVETSSTKPLFITETQKPESLAAQGVQTESGDPVIPMVRDVAATLLPKLLRTTRLLFGSSRSFFFSYDYDITQNLASQKHFHSSEIPLYKEVEPLFFWNRNVIQPFMDGGQTSFVLPLMQGFVGQRSFTVDKNPVVPPKKEDPSTVGLEMKEIPTEDHQMLPEPGIQSYTNKNTSSISDAVAEDVDTKPCHSEVSEETRTYLMTLISRRSVKRAGLRYLRRGIDDEGNTANSVETEQILSSTDWSPHSKIYSFVQVRGSIPLFFSQSPYSFKPVPQLQQSPEANFLAFKLHFSNLTARYGSLQAVSLVEKNGVEAVVGEEYRKTMARLNESGGIGNAKLGFEWFDFHAICRGMKFENVSFLLDALGSILDKFAMTVEFENKLTRKQSGVLRTNCMDCLDRTNVVQSACGRRALETQLQEEGFDLNLQVDQTTEWFNTLWADNGDAISKQYASTAALKGDFTRTRKRDYKGAITDMGLSISRFYSGIVNDYFSQAAIDFLLGNVTSMVFEDFESNLMSTDPAISVRKVRQQAIEVSQHLVIEDQNEELIGGWALLTPRDLNTIKSTPFEESVLLVTDAALYACRFDWNMEKVSSFERVELRHVVRIQHGTYVTSTLSIAQADEERNVGFVISYKAGANDISRVNTRSMSTTASRETSDLLQETSVTAPLSLPGLLGGKPPNSDRILAFKALPARSAVAEKQGSVPAMSEIEQVMHICAEIERLVLAWQVVEIGAEKKSIIESGDIISLAEARKSTGLFEQLGHSLKKLVWA